MPPFFFLFSPQRRSKCRLYHTAFPNRETSYGTADGVSWPYCTDFRVSYRFRAGNRGGGGVSCNIGGNRHLNVSYAFSRVHIIN
jgi:hypothetical protein